MTDIPVPHLVTGVRRETADTASLTPAPAGQKALEPFTPGRFAMVYAFGVGEIPVSKGVQARRRPGPRSPLGGAVPEFLLAQQIGLRHDADHVVTGVDDGQGADTPPFQGAHDLLEGGSGGQRDDRAGHHVAHGVHRVVHGRPPTCGMASRHFQPRPCAPVPSWAGRPCLSSTRRPDDGR